MGHVARACAVALLLAGCTPAPQAASPCPGTAEGAIAALPLPPHQTTGNFKHLLLSDAARDFCTAVPDPVPAYLMLQDREGRKRYTRRGEFELVPAEQAFVIRHVSGLDIWLQLVIPADVDRFGVTPDGVVTIVHDGQTQELGRLFATLFPRPEALKALADDVFEATPEAGEPYEVSGPMIGAPIFHQGKLITLR